MCIIITPNNKINTPNSNITDVLWHEENVYIDVTNIFSTHWNTELMLEPMR